MTHDQLAKEFAELNGIRWYEWENSIGFTRRPNPTYSTAESVLEVMMKREDWDSFNRIIGGVTGGEKVIAIDYIIKPDKLLTAAVTWCVVQGA